MDESKEISPPRPYHHGDLRAALIEAAEAELDVSGIEGFTLRGCARRAGVSHAAPAHHFKDVNGLLAAVATLGFDRLTHSMQRFGASAALGTVDYIVAIGRGYVAFALAHPAQFRLVFQSGKRDLVDAALARAGDAAFGILVEAVSAYRGIADAMADPVAAREVLGLWSLVHGLSDLAIAGHIESMAGVTVDDLVASVAGQFLAGQFLTGRGES